MKELIEMIEIWKDNPENMQQSYPYGLGQYLQESLEDRDSLLQFIEAVVDNPYLILNYGEVNGLTIDIKLI